MFTWLGFKALLASVRSFLRAIPWQVYAGLIVACVLASAQLTWLARARMQGDSAARAELQPKLTEAKAELLDAWTAAADAEGRDKAHADGLSACIGARMLMDTITASTLAQRQAERTSAAHALDDMRGKLSHAYSLSADRCAAEPVPDAVLRVLDGGHATQPDPHAERADRGAAVRAGADRADLADPRTTEAGPSLSRHGAVDRDGMASRVVVVQQRQGSGVDARRGGSEAVTAATMMAGSGQCCADTTPCCDASMYTMWVPLWVCRNYGCA